MPAHPLHPAGTGATCRSCGDLISYSEVRDPADPWVHNHAAQQPHHQAVPLTRNVTVKVVTYLEPQELHRLVTRLPGVQSKLFKVKDAW